MMIRDIGAMREQREAYLGFPFRCYSHPVINQFSRGFAAALLADLIVSAIAGADERKELQGVIRGLIEPRLALARASRQNDAMLEVLNGLAVALTALTRTRTFRNAIEAEQLEMVDTIVANGVDNVATRIAALDDAQVRAELDLLDRQRSSFTAEDKAA